MRSPRISILISVADILWIVLALYLAYECRYGFHVNLATLRDCFADFGETAIAAAMIWSFLNVVMKLDGFNGGWAFRTVFSDLSVGVLLLMALLLTNEYLLRTYQSRLVFIYFGTFTFGGLLAVRCLARLILGSELLAASRRRVVILGGGRIARELSSKIMRHPEMRWQVVGFLFPEASSNGEEVGEAEIHKVHALDVADFLAERQVDEVIIAVENPAQQTLDLVAQCRRSGIGVLVVPQAYELYTSRPVLAELDGLPLLAVDQYAVPTGSQVIRRLTDLVLVPLLLVAVLPVMFLAVVVLALRKGKAFRRELRCGKDGTPFWMYRLNVNRNMPILPAYERWFADLGLTELPQLWNVLRGDMNLVGPRPESPERVKRYSDWQRQRLKIKPGITGLAQIHGLREQHSAEQKTHYDLQYMLRWSPFLDFSLILQSAWTLVARIAAREDVRREPPTADRLWAAEPEALLEETVHVNHS